jgi:hypothetical protein
MHTLAKIGSIPLRAEVAEGKHTYFSGSKRISTKPRAVPPHGMTIVPLYCVDATTDAKSKVANFVASQHMQLNQSRHKLFSTS